MLADRGKERLLWSGIAMLATEDGIEDRRDESPTANSIRRVWHRVHHEKKERMARAEVRAAARGTS